MSCEGGDVIAADTMTDGQLLDAEQALRIRRLGMASVSYLVSFTLIAICSWLDLLPWSASIVFLLFSLTIIGAFLLVFQSGINLRFNEPSLTAIQMIVSMLPMLYVMFHLDAGQVRAILLMTVIVPALYGMLALGSRQMIYVCAIFLAFYGALLAALWVWRNDVIDPSLELIQAVTLILVVSQVAIIGGFYSDLRQKLKDRNGELKEAMTRISELANHDELTGLANRRHLLSILEQEAYRYQRARGPFCVGIIDIDHFKETNDTHGHAAGDLVLRRISQAAAASLRHIDSIGRYGGEEFLLILPQTSLVGALTKAERLRVLVAELRFPEIADDLAVTISVGIAEYRAGESIDETINRADQALYRAKDAGRNRCMVED